MSDCSSEGDIAIGPRAVFSCCGVFIGGLGLRAPVVSWGVLLQDAQSFRAVAIHPWLLLPALAVIVTVLMFNFLGAGLRDAADPYKR